jgi:WD40 repeat protein
MTLDRPQIHTIISQSLQYAPYDVKWLPCSAKVLCTGHSPRGTGILQLYELDANKLEKVHESEKTHAIKCCTFGASPLHLRHVATGDFDGRMAIYDVERMESPIYSVKAHDAIINCIDGCGGVGVNVGPPEIVTGSRDGSVKVWDPRQKDRPVAVIAPAKGEATRDAWAVALGNSHTDEDRVLAAGYENGDIKLFDLKNMSLMYESNVKNGVCAIEFDRRDIKMNKLVVATLEATVQVFDLRTQHPKEGFASTKFQSEDNTTVWTVKHLPQNRDVFMTSAGNGGINVFK